MYKNFHKKAHTFAKDVENDVRVRMHTASLNSQGRMERTFLKLIVLMAVAVASLSPLWVGLILYSIAVTLASILGIAVIGLKVAVFIMLLLVLGQLQLICLIAGFCIAIAVIIS